jgi:predicted ATPase/class 3 adenylate cyclase
MPDADRPPTGTVTFLFTDVEGSTRLWAADEAAMSASLLLHDSIVREAIESVGGFVFTTAGDSFAAAFGRPSDALLAATTAQASFSSVVWPGPTLRVRMGLHMGEAEERDGDYFGSVVNTTARVEAAGHGGQILITDAVRATADVAATDLGIHRLRDVEQPVQLYQIGNASHPPLRTDNPRLSNLPVRPTRLIGREDDVATIQQLLAADRLVTLTAVGGSGKTRLAQAVGESELGQRSDGVWFVDLTAVQGRHELPEAIASAVGLALRIGDAVDQVIEYLIAKSALVILDNCEHLIDDVADFAERFLGSAGRASLLATSREMLDIDGERVYSVQPLASDGADSAGVMLFLDRAIAIDPGFVIDESNVDAVSTLCSRLDGIPLAIELAAIQVSVMTAKELLAGLDDRFQMLSGGRRRRRQRTLEATLDWSYDLLDQQSQQVFRTLGVFVDGFDLRSAAAVTGLSLPAATAAIQSLVAKSLVVRVERDDISRFGMLETVKAYAEERLVETGQTADVRRAHFEHYSGLATVHGPTLLSEIHLCFELRHDQSNLSAAFEWAAARDEWSNAADLLNGAFSTYELFGRNLEGLSLMRRAIEGLGSSDPDLIDHLLAQCLPALVNADDFAQAQAYAIRLAESAAPHIRVLGLAFHGWAVSYSRPGRSGELFAQAQRDLDIARTDAPGRNTELAAVVLGAYRAGNRCVAFDYSGALTDAEEAIAIEDRLNFHTEFGSAPGAVTVAAMCLVLLDRPRDALQLLGDQDPDLVRLMQVANGDPIRVFALLELGDLDDARDLVCRLAVGGLARRYAYEANDCVVMLAGLALAEGDAATATELVLSCGTGSGWAVIVADNLAMRLEVTEQRHRRIIDSIRSRNTSHNTQQAADALRIELDRRDWTPRNPPTGSRAHVPTS